MYGNVSQARAKEILDKPMAKLWTDQQRANAEKPPINYPQPTAAQKEALEAYDVKKAEIEANKARKGKGKGKEKARAAKVANSGAPERTHTRHQSKRQISRTYSTRDTRPSDCLPLFVLYLPLLHHL